MDWHNKFHLEMPHGLINDPNGLCYHQGKYQIFFQWNPFSCEHKHKHWAYTQTTDFIHYTKPEIALAPVDSFDKNGCYSGSARSRQGQLEIFYTANLKDAQDIRYPRQILAKKNDDGSFSKTAIIINDVPEGYTTHFRDPYLFTKDNRSFMVLGAQRANLTGCALIYEEIDASWQFRGELKTQLTDFGYMWECPNFITIGQQDILLFCPQGLSTQGTKYQNLYQSGYIIGQFNPDTLEFVHGDFYELDMGFDFYAPQVLVHENRHILLGWIGMPDRLAEYPSTTAGWVHSLTMPRELSLRDNRLYQKPIVELTALEQHGATERITAPCKLAISVALAEIDVWQATLQINDEQILLAYDKNSALFTIDREGLKLGGKGVRKCLLPTDERLNLELYIDTSIIELYAQDGQQCATLCYYPEKQVNSIGFQQNTNNAITNIVKLNSIRYE